VVSTVCVVYLKFHVRAGLSGQYISTVCVVYLKFHVRAGLSGQYSVRGVSEVPR